MRSSYSPSRTSVADRATGQGGRRRGAAEPAAAGRRGAPAFSVPASFGVSSAATHHCALSPTRLSVHLLARFPMIAANPETMDSPPRLRVGAVVWAAGMLGVVAMAFYLPEMIEAFGEDAPDAPAWLPLVFVVQYGLLVALFSAIGAAVSTRLGLHSPVAEAVASGSPVGPSLRPQVVPGLIGGVLGAILLAVAVLVAPDAITALEGQWEPPLWLRALYGGITEEVLLRWGVMTGLVWLGWRFAQRREGLPKPWIIWAAIVASALLFGAGHLPAASALIGSLSAPVVAYVVLANSVFGLIAGWLYWKWGLEAAIIAHVGAHVGSVLFAFLAP